MNSANLFCCLCSYMASSDFDLEAHIDYSHSDIFRTSAASNATREMKSEQVID
jgi:hypothetical protein